MAHLREIRIPSGVRGAGPWPGGGDFPGVGLAVDVKEAAEETFPQKRVAPGQASAQHLFCTSGGVTVVGSQPSGHSQDSALRGSGQTQANSRALAKPWSSLAPPCGPGDKEAA